MTDDGPDLAEYARKRDFGATPEPAGGASSSSDGDGALRFVIQEHSATRLHWDLRLEHDGALASWAIPNGLPWALRDNRLAVHTEDHPLEYLEFHGSIPKGSYGAGTMTIWDRGTYEVLKWDARKVEVRLHGERVTGEFALFPIGPEEKDWMIHRMGAPAGDTPGGWVLGSEEMPTALVPMLAKAGPVPPAREDASWAYEIKWDGVRAVCFSEPGRMRFVTRNGNDVTARYPELARMNRALSMHRVVLDGEVVAFDADGRPSFGALQGRMHLAQGERGQAAGQGEPGHVHGVRPGVVGRGVAGRPALPGAARGPARAAGRRRALAGPGPCCRRWRGAAGGDARAGAGGDRRQAGRLVVRDRAARAARGGRSRTPTARSS